MDETKAAAVAARQHIENADRTAALVAAKGGWHALYMAGFGVGFGAEVVLLGMVKQQAVRMTAFSVTWVVFVAGMVWWSRRQDAWARGVQKRMLPSWIGTIALYAAAMFFGPVVDNHSAAFWLPAGAVVAAPLLMGAWRERGRLRR